MFRTKRKNISKHSKYRVKASKNPKTKSSKCSTCQSKSCRKTTDLKLLRTYMGKKFRQKPKLLIDDGASLWKKAKVHR